MTKKPKTCSQEPNAEMSGPKVEEQSESRRKVKIKVTPDTAIELQTRQHAIGLELQRMFDDVTKEPIPESFLALLDQIDRKKKD